MALVICLHPRLLGGEANRENLVKITSEKSGEGTRFMVENLQEADVTVTFKLESENMRSSAALPLTRTIPGRAQVELATVSPADAGRPWKWSYTYYATFGSLEARHDEDAVYELPYAPGESFRVSQGYHGQYSHFGANEFAIDWKMPCGTAIHAAREGVVVAARDDSDSGGPDSRYDADANYILIRHADGTLGHYVHLLHRGNRARVGDRVRSGQWIGRSGNTGHSTGPHLHFSVFKARNGRQRETLPVTFRTTGALTAALETGKNYKAPGTAVAATTETQPARGSMAVGRP